MNKFKKGDKVRCIKTSRSMMNKVEITKGMIYEVIDVVNTSGGKEHWLTVEDDNGNKYDYFVTSFELVTQAMPTPLQIENGEYDVIHTRDGLFYNYNYNESSKNIFKADFLTKELKSEDVEDLDIMAVYKQNGYELELVWQREEEKTKEEQVIEILLNIKNGLSSECEVNDDYIDKAINLLKENTHE